MSDAVLPPGITFEEDPPDLVGAAREAADFLASFALGAFTGDLNEIFEQPDRRAEAARIAQRLTEAVAKSAPLSQRVWSPAELAAHWGVSPNTVRGWIDDGELEVFNVSRGTVPHWRIVNAEALRFAEERRKKKERGT